MDITLGIGLLSGLYLIYVLLIKGALWKIIIGIAGWIGIYQYLCTIDVFCEYPFNNDTFTWATIIPTIILILAASYTKED